MSALTKLWAKDYSDARAAAQTHANRLGRDVMLEKVAKSMGGGYAFRSLPSLKYRRGHELRAEVVQPEVVRQIAKGL